MDSPKPRKTYFVRFLEILPGSLTWITLIGAPVLSFYSPATVAIYIIVFDLYWFLKGANVAIHLMHSYRNLKTHRQIDWIDWLKQLGDLGSFKSHIRELILSEKDKNLKSLYKDQLFKLNKIESDRNLDWNRIYHLIILPIYQENKDVIEASIKSYVNADYPHEKKIIVLSTEERAGEEYYNNTVELAEKYKDQFFTFITVKHPDGIAGEARGKGANITFGARAAQKYLDQMAIPYENVIVSAFDSDTLVSPNYFSHLSFDFLTIDKPHQASYQPMPMFHNNIWDTPAIARVIATSSSFWQLVEASRPDRLVTFSSHAMSFKTLVDVGFWRVDIIPEDSHIFWQCFLHFNGDYRTHPLFTTVSMDAVLGKSYFGTLVAQYKQKRRWAWGVTEIALVLPEVLKNKLIPKWKKFIYMERLIEGHYFWATASIMIAILGWTPLIFGGDRFGETVLAVNLPFLTRLIMSIATFFLIFSMYVNIVLLPIRPARYGRWKSISMVLQWVFTPIVSSVFGSLPAIDAQTRLMLGKYMEFWVTPKIRKNEIEINLPEPSKARVQAK